MAKKPPYFKFFPKDFAADSAVEAMSTQGVGAYILLLCKAWHEDPPGSLPSDDRTLARFSRLSSDEWAEVKPEVLAAFTLGDDNRIHQKRMRREFEDLRSKAKQRQKAAQARWDKAKAEQEPCTSNADALRGSLVSGSLESPEGESAERGRLLDVAEQAVEAWSLDVRQHPMNASEAGTLRQRLKGLNGELAYVPDAVRRCMRQGVKFKSVPYICTPLMEKAEELAHARPHDPPPPAYTASGLWHRCRSHFTFGGDRKPKQDVGHHDAGLIVDGNVWVPADRLGEVRVDD